MASQEHFELLKQHLELREQGSMMWKVWRDENLVVSDQAYAAMLAGDPTPIGDRHPIDLSSANLAGAVLNRYDFADVDLHDANLAGAFLLLADLSRANLAGANLKGATLSGATLHQATLAGADLTGAKLKRATLTGRADLSGANLSFADLSNANLEGANLAWSDLSNATLNGANLASANLSGAQILFTFLSQANLASAILTEATICGSQFLEVNLVGAILTHIKHRDPAMWSHFTNSLLMKANLTGADLPSVNFTGANLSDAVLVNATITPANFSAALLIRANLDGVDLRQADLRTANMLGASLIGANLSSANLSEANLVSVELTGANLSQSNLDFARLVGVNLKQASVVGCNVYGTSVWDLALEEADQSGLIITPFNTKPTITVDNLEIAQFIYLLVNNKRIRSVIDTLTSKVVLILGRFTPERKVVLDAIREALHEYNYVSVIFDFDQPASRNVTETVSTLAHMARFVIADITGAKSIPQELQRIVPDLPSVPIQPLLHVRTKEYGMFESFRDYPWVLEPYRYTGIKQLLGALKDKVIAPAEAKAKNSAS